MGLRRWFRNLNKKKEEPIISIIPTLPETIFGKNNKVLLIKNGQEINIDNTNYNLLEGITLYIKGNNNTIIIEEPYIIENTYISLYETNDSFVHIKSKCKLYNLTINFHLGGNQKVILGNNNVVNGSLQIQCTEFNSGFISGGDCLFASNIKILCDDAHTILEKGTTKIINTPNQFVNIGQHCWIGDNVLMGKNASIPNNTIVAMGSVVTKLFSKTNTVIGGNPSKVIKSDVDWHEFRIFTYQSKLNSNCKPSDS